MLHKIDRGVGPFCELVGRHRKAQVHHVGPFAEMMKRK